MVWCGRWYVSLAACTNAVPQQQCASNGRPSAADAAHSCCLYPGMVPWSRRCGPHETLHHCAAADLSACLIALTVSFAAACCCPRSRAVHLMFSGKDPYIGQVPAQIILSKVRSLTARRPWQPPAPSPQPLHLGAVHCLLHCLRNPASAMHAARRQLLQQRRLLPSAGCDRCQTG